MPETRQLTSIQTFIVVWVGQLFSTVGSDIGDAIAGLSSLVLLLLISLTSYSFRNLREVEAIVPDYFYFSKYNLIPWHLMANASTRLRRFV